MYFAASFAPRMEQAASQIQDSRDFDFSEAGMVRGIYIRRRAGGTNEGCHRCKSFPDREFGARKVGKWSYFRRFPGLAVSRVRIWVMATAASRVVWAIRPMEGGGAG